MANLANSMDGVLTKFALGYEVKGVPQVLPRVTVKAGNHTVRVRSYTKDAIATIGLQKRELGAAYPVREPAKSDVVTVNLERYSGRETVDRDDPAYLGGQGALLLTAKERAALLRQAGEMTLARLEAQAIVTTSNYSATTTPGTKWNANGDFIADITAAINAVAGAIGLEPDTLVIPQRVLLALGRNDNTQKLFVGTGVKPTAPNAIAQALRDYFGFAKVVVTPRVVASDEGFTDVYSDNVAVLYLGQGFNLLSERLPVWGLVFREDGYPRVRTREGEVGLDIFYDDFFAVKVFNKEAGHLITDVL